MPGHCPVTSRGAIASSVGCRWACWWSKPAWPVVRLQGWQNLPPAIVDKFDHPLLALLHAAPQTSESLAHCSELPLAEVLVQLTELELEGRVSNEAGRWFARAG